MRFAVTDKREFWWPVTVRMPDETTAGQIVEAGFEARFEALPSERAVALEKAIREAAVAEGIVAAETAVIESVTRSWRGVEDASGNNLPFSAEALGQACRWAWFRAGVIAAFRQAMAGEEARRKN